MYALLLGLLALEIAGLRLLPTLVSSLLPALLCFLALAA
jgi:hypothetical protein